MRKRENDNDDVDVAIIGGIPGVPFKGTQKRKEYGLRKEAGDASWHIACSVGERV